jgi:hypothetical protein
MSEIRHLVQADQEMHVRGGQVDMHDLFLTRKHNYKVRVCRLQILVQDTICSNKSCTNVRGSVVACVALVS